MYSTETMSFSLTAEQYVRKRDGKTLVLFDRTKITEAISKALLSSGEVGEDHLQVATFISCKVVADLTCNRTFDDVANNTPFEIEHIQDVVENHLMQSGLPKAAKKFIIYRKNRSDARELAETNLINFIEDYFKKAVWDIKENSNMDYSLQGLNNFVTSKVMNLYWMNKVYSPDAKAAHQRGDFHIHDASLLSVYCCGWSLEDLLSWGFGGVAGTNSSGPAKHFDAALGQIWNFLYSLQGEAAGAQALSNFDTYLAPFIRYDKLSYKEVKQCFQKFFHNMTTKTRVGFQAPFTNVSMDLYVPEHMKNEAVIIGGVRQDSTYSDYQTEMDMINKAFCEVMIEGDYEGRQFSFPIPNYSISKDFDWDNPNLEPLWALTGKYGAPYFTNFVNSDLKPEDVRSMCPLHPDERIDIRMNGNYVSMRMEDVHKVLAYKTLGNVFVRLNDKEIPVVGVTRHTSKGFVKIYTDLDPQGICMDHVHQQPYRLCMINHEGKRECTSVETVEAFFLPKQHCYVPYSKTNFKDFLPSEALDLDGMIWVPVRRMENVGRVTQYSYCIAVGSDDHLFEMGPGRLITHNCRLQLDNRELRKRGGGLFGANPLTGSVGVVTINLPKLGYKFRGDRETFFSELARLMDLAAESLQMKRMFIEKKCDEGLYPFSRYYMRHIKAAKGEYYYNHFSTIGVVGGNECIRNFYRGEDIDIRHPQGYEFTKEIQDFMRERMKMYQEKYGYPFNLEATPAEGVSYRLAKLDTDQYPDIITATSNIESATDVYYTNSTQLPVDATFDIFEACEHQDSLQTKYTGGTVLHLYLGEEIRDTKVVKELIKKVCMNYHIPYITLSPKYSVCANHGYLAGEQNTCPSCGNEAEVYARVVGFYTPTNRWNKGKQAEFQIRNDYDPETILSVEFPEPVVEVVESE